MNLSDPDSIRVSGLRQFHAYSFRVEGSPLTVENTVGALIIRIGCWGLL